MFFLFTIKTFIFCSSFLSFIRFSRDVLLNVLDVNIHELFCRNRILWNQTASAKHMFLLIYWQSVTNSDRVFEKSQFISWIQILSDIFCLKASIFAVLFHSSFSTRFKNSEKKLVNSWFCCQSFSSFIAALCLWLVSSYIHFRSEMNRSRVQNVSFWKKKFIVQTASSFK